MEQIYIQEKRNPYVYAIRRGLILSIPLLLIGSFSLIFKFFPLESYQSFINTFAGGALVVFFTRLNEATFGILSLCITICISASYAQLYTANAGKILGCIFASLSAYMLFVGFLTPDFNSLSFGAHGMFTAIFSAVIFSALYMSLVRSELFALRLYTIGADRDFNTVISVCLPVGIAIATAYLLNLFIRLAFGINGLEALFHKIVTYLFTTIAASSIKVLLYVLLSSIFWFFGVHGTNALYVVEDIVFVEQSGIFTKPFIDVFVLMGGCGTTLSLVIAIMLFGKQKNTRSLSKYASFPMLFNINELIVFGLPIVYNPFFFIPFLTVPLICIAVAYLAVATGLVPQPHQGVSWVMPVILNGYQATGSIGGSLLQLLNLTIGVFIYRYFLIRYEDKTSERMMEDLNWLVKLLQESEAKSTKLAIMELKGSEGAIARMLAEDLRHVVKTPGSFSLYYQPQFDINNQCIGAEALLRWNHPRCGMIYPPLLIGIATETGLLAQLERTIFETAFLDIKQMQEKGVCPPKISVNATSASLQDEGFVDYLKEHMSKDPKLGQVLVLELTEQMSFSLSDAVERQLKDIKSYGVHLAVDDFSMGHTSLSYLQTDLFDLVKLDGSLIKNMMVNSRTADIVSSIIQLSKNMNFNVLAEFVETEEQQALLENFGCIMYQGYLYSPAVPLDALINLLEKQ